MKEEIFVIPHQNPDTDSICAAISYAYFLRKKGKRAKPVRLGELNKETTFVLNFFKIKDIPLLESGENKLLILVDHNEKEQSIPHLERAKILEVIDHHKISFSYSEPISFLTQPVGATSTIIAKKFLENKIKLDKKIAGLLLSGILSDTVVFKSPTTTKEDIYIAKKLSNICKIKDIKKFGMEIKKQKATLKGLSISQIVQNDAKEYDINGKKFLVSQVEICDLKEIEPIKKELLTEMEKIVSEKNLDFFLFMATDIIKLGSQILIKGKEIEEIEKIFNKKIEENSFYLPGVLSRKKEIIPPLMEYYSKFN